MGMFDGVVNNPFFKNFAADKARGFFADNKVTCILVRQAPEKEGQVLPGFDIDLYDKEVQCVTKEWSDAHLRSDITHPYRLTPEEWAEYQNLKKKRNGTK